MKFTQKLYRFQLIGVFFFLFILLSAASCYIHYDGRKQVAKLLFKSIIPLDTVGDIRGVISSLREADLGGFECISLHNNRGDTIFQLIPQNCTKSSKWPWVRQFTSSKNTYYFYINSKVYIFHILGSLFVVILLFQIAAFFQRKKIKYENDIAIEIRRMELFNEVVNQVRHDISSPLAAIAVVARTLPESFVDQKEILTQSTARIKLVASDLDKNTGEIPTGDDAFNFKIHSVDIGKALKKLIVQKRMEYPNVAFSLNIEEEYSESLVFTDATHFERAISNIVNNAVEACASVLEKRISITLRKASPDLIEVCVTDNGIGIDDSIVDKIFAKGFTTNKIGGSGLGLFHAEKLTKASRGFIKTEKNTPSGLRVIILFRRADI